MAKVKSEISISQGAVLTAKRLYRVDEGSFFVFEDGLYIYCCDLGRDRNVLRVVGSVNNEIKHFPGFLPNATLVSLPEAVEITVHM